MKIFIKTAIIVLFGITTSFAQIPNVHMDGDTLTGAPGSQVDIGFHVKEFWNITNIEGTIEWDTTVVQFDTISSFALPYFDPTTFDLTNAANGQITFEWAHLITIGSTLTDGDIVFTLKFDLIGNDGDSTLVQLTNSPVPLYWYNFAGWSGTIEGGPGQIHIACTQMPVAGYSTSANGLTYNFTDLSTGPVDNWFWDFGDGNTDTLQNPIHTFAMADTFDVCLVVSSVCGTDSTCMQVITNNPTGLSDSGPLGNIKLFPNPVKSQLTISLKENPKQVIWIEVYNSTGSKLNESRKSYQSEYRIDMSKYPSGTYYLRIGYKDQEITKIFIKD